MEFNTPKEIANQWGISEQEVRRLCERGKVLGAKRMGLAWAILSDTPRPSEEDTEQQLPDLERIRFSHLGLSEGLSQGTVNCILQDKRGSMWFGTQNGLNRYDGYNITVFDQGKLGDAGAVILCLYEDNRGGLWVASANHLHRFDCLTETCEDLSYETSPETSIASNRVVAMSQDIEDEKYIWAATGHGLLSIELGTGKMEQYTIDAESDLTTGNQMRSMQDDGKGCLWLGTHGAGLICFNKNSRSFERATTNYLHLRVSALHRSADGELIVGTDKDGIFVYDAVERQLQPYGSKELQTRVSEVLVTHIGMDAYGSMWVTSTGGAFVYSPETEYLVVLQHDRFDRESLPSNWVRTLYFDPKGRVWLGSLTGGVSMYDPWKYKFQHINSVVSHKSGLVHNLVRCFCEDRLGRLWIGTEGGLNRYDDITGEYINYFHDVADLQTINSNNVRGMYLDRKDRLWVFTWGGICYYDYDSDKFVRYTLPQHYEFNIKDSELVFYYEDSQNGVWIGSSDSGLVFYDPEHNIYELYSASPTSPRRIMGDRQRFIFEDSQGSIYLTTLAGHSAVNRMNGLITNYAVGEQYTGYPFARHLVFCRYEDDTSVWVGTIGGLFRQSQESKEWTHYTVADGLPNNVIYGILPDEQGMLWMSTNRGITRFNPSTGRFRNFVASDGLQSDEFNNSAYYKARNGELFFGGVNGFNRFFPAAIQDSMESVRLCFTGFLVSNEKLPRTGLIEQEGVLTIPYSARTFGFEFAALEYSHPRKIRYECMLEGFEEGWQSLGFTRVASYRNVPSGHYVFRVRSTNKDGVWGKNDISIDVRIEQAQWLLTLNPGDLMEERGSELVKYLEEIETKNLELQAKNEALQNVNRNLVASVYHDALTGIYNRAGYKRFMDLYAAQKYQPLGLVVVDVDGLKLVNDNLGHEVGDGLIQRVATLLQSLEVAQAHTVARIGGDEFVILIANCTRALLGEIYNQILVQQEAHNRKYPDRFVSLSPGCSMTDNTSREKLFVLADEAMYQYKQQNGEEARRRVWEYIGRQKMSLTSNC